MVSPGTTDLTSLYFHYSTYKGEQWSRRDGAAVCTMAGDIRQYWKVGCPYVILPFLSNTFFALFLSLLKQLYLSSWFFSSFSYCEYNCPYRNNNFLKPFSLCLLCGKNTAASSSSRTYNEQYFQFNVISRKVLINKRQNFFLLKTKFYFYFKPDGNFLCLIWLLCAGLLNLESDLYKTY